MLIIWIILFLAARVTLALNQAYMVFFIFPFLGTAVKYLDIRNVMLFLQP